MFSPSSAITSASKVAPSPRSRTRTKSTAGDVTTLFSSSSPLLLSIGFAPPSPSRYPTSTYTAHYTNNNVSVNNNDNNNNVDAPSRKIRGTTVATAGESPQIHLTPTFSSGFSPRIGGPVNGGASPRYRKAAGSIGGFGGGGGGGSGLGLGVSGGGSFGTTWEKQQQQPFLSPDDQNQQYELQTHRTHHPLAQTVLTYNDPDLLADGSSSSPLSASTSLSSTTTSSSQAAAFEDEYEHHPLYTQALHHPLSISYIGRKHARTVKPSHQLHLLSSPSFKSAPKFLTNRAFVFILFWTCFVVFLSALFGVGAPAPEEVDVGLRGLRTMPIKATSWSGASLSRELVNQVRGGVGELEVVFEGEGGTMVGLGGGAMKRFDQSSQQSRARGGDEKRKVDGGRRNIFFGKFLVGPRAYGWERARG